ncbi:MAG TPA: glycosyltransferase family 2 protein [Chthoniobacterales bacterium]|nr:glycosyltransferase family 2 protein [Chthoniobacterales bacterium]
MNQPQVSVVIPTFNRSQIVRGAIDSVLAQTAPGVETIVVDDGSTDDTVEQLSRYGDAIRVIRRDNNGVSAARNTGIRAARGRWVAFLDSDDRWQPRKLERQLSCLEKLDAGVCFTRCIGDDGELIHDTDNLAVVRGENGYFHLANPLDLLGRKGWHPALPTMVVEKRLLEENGLFDESLVAAEDTQLIYKLAFVSRFAYVDEPLVTVARTPSDGLTCNYDPELAKQRLDSYIRVQAEAYFRLLDVDPKKALAPRKVMGYFMSRRAEMACGAGEFAIARAFAMDGIFFSRYVRSLLTCLAIYIWPALFRNRFHKKWFVEPMKIVR